MGKTVLYDGVKKVKSIDVIFMFKNDEEYLNKFFVDITKAFEDTYDVDFNYFCIDNNSSDNTRDILRVFFKTKSKKSKLILHHVQRDYKNIGNGKNYDRISNLSKLRNLLVDNITPLESDWCLFIDSNIFFKKEILDNMFKYQPCSENIGMMIPYTQQLFIPEIHKIKGDKPALLKHFYDTFSIFNTNGKSYWPYCPFEKCMICDHSKCKDRETFPSVPIHDINSGFGGFVLLETEILNNPLIRWDTLSHNVENDESICEHYLFSYMLKKLTKKRIVVLQEVDDIYRTY